MVQNDYRYIFILLSLSGMLPVLGIILLVLVGTSISEKERVEVLLWSGGTWAGFGSGPELYAPNYLGHTVYKEECPVDCIYTGDRGRTGLVGK